MPPGLAAPIVVGLVVALVLLPQTSGHHSSPGANQRPRTAASGAATRVVSAASQSPPVTAPAAATPTATTLPADPYLQPDGSALPLLVVFNGHTIDVSGAVPSAAVGQRLSALAESYSKTPNAQVVAHVVVDPRVPTSTGVRVIEMDAARFASGSSQITPQYAPELSRVITILKAMPRLTALVIGHADQTGNHVQNLGLAESRATAVIEYLVSQGISSDRLSAQGVGDSSLLTRQSDAAGLALNRRTEFIFYGLMAGT